MSAMQIPKKKGDDIINNINKTLVNSIDQGVRFLKDHKYVDIEEIEQKMPFLYSAWKQDLFDTDEYPWRNANRKQLTVPSQSCVYKSFLFFFRVVLYSHSGFLYSITKTLFTLMIVCIVQEFSAIFSHKTINNKHIRFFVIKYKKPE